MAIIIPALVFGGLLTVFAGRIGFRQGFVYAAAVYALGLAAAVELLSLASWLTFWPLLGFWAVMALAIGLYLRLRGDWKTLGERLRDARELFLSARVELSAAVAVLAVVLLVAVVAPPNNWDAMAYRMARMAMWAQQGNIEHFPTAYMPQLHHPPLTEWNFLNFQILSGGDYFANTVQWFYLAGCGIAASLIARELKADFPVQVLAAVVAVTLPMGLLQGSSAQNDVAVSFWILLFALFTIQYLRGPAAGRLIFCGLALGFALLTKGTAYAVIPGVAVPLFLYGMIRAKEWRPSAKIVSGGLAILAMALLLNAGHYARNWNLFEHPLSPTGEALHSSTHLNEEFNFPVTWANLVRNSAMHWGVPNREINDFTLDAVRTIFGEGIDQVPGSTLGRLSFYEWGILFRTHEYHTGNFLHFWVLAASLLGVFLLAKWLKFDALTVCLALTVVAAALLFSSVLMWERWNTRYHTPIFMLGAPVVAVFIGALAARVKSSLPAARPRPVSRRERRAARRRPADSTAQVSGYAARLFTSRGWVGMASGLFLIMSLPWVISNELRPVVTSSGAIHTSRPSILDAERTEMYFRNNPSFYIPYITAIDYLATEGVDEFGIYMPASDYDYPIWALYRERTGEWPRLTHVGVENISAELRDGNYAPQVIFSRNGAFETLEGRTYSVAQEFPGVTIMVRDDDAG